MTDTLKLAPTLALPLSAITVTSAIVGIRNSGKTNTAVVEAEELLEHGQQIVAIDPTDSWWGLKSSKDGTKPGYPVVILGGRHQDLPLAANDGATIADFVVESRASVIVSLRHFESKADVQRFITDFARRLYFRKGQQDDPTPVKLFIDEASLVVPQRVMGDEARMVGAIQQLVRQGRSSGIGVALIDQRPATINKDVLTQLELLVCHRITSPQDRKALVAWVEQHDTEGSADAFLDSLAALEQGDAWFWSPGWLDLFKKVHVRERRTFDSSRTPKPGERVLAPTRVAEVDLDALKAKLSATIEKARADDPAALRKEIARLQSEIRKAAGGKPTKPIVDTAAIDRAVHAAIAKRSGAAGKALDRVVGPLNRMKDLLGSAIEGLDGVRAAWQNGDGAAPIVSIGDSYVAGKTIALQIVDRPKPAARIPQSASNEGLRGAQQKILNALAQLESLGIAPASTTQVAIFAGYTESGHFDNTRGALRTKGLIEYPQGGMVALTDEGRSNAQSGGEFRSLEELHEFVFSKLNSAQAKLLRPLIEAFPDAITVEELARRAGFSTSGHFDNMRGRLRTMGLADYPQGGMIRASDLLFPKGLR